MLDFLTQYGLIGLFLSSFLSSTILPFSSEVVFATLIATQTADITACFILATTGNTLGAMTCYGLGYIGNATLIKKFTGEKEEKIDKWVKLIQKKGTWLAIFSFLPIIGDVIAIGTGFAKCNFALTSLFFMAGKGIRYAVVIAITKGMISAI